MYTFMHFLYVSNSVRQSNVKSNLILHAIIEYLCSHKDV